MMIKKKIVVVVEGFCDNSDRSCPYFWDEHYGRVGCSVHFDGDGNYRKLERCDDLRVQIPEWCSMETVEDDDPESVCGEMEKFLMDARVHGLLFMKINLDEAERLCHVMYELEAYGIALTDRQQSVWNEVSDLVKAEHGRLRKKND